MILMPDKWLFVSTMKCATNSLYYDLEKAGGQWAGGKDFHGIPRERMAPYHWSVCRNPYDRAVSIWASTCVRPKNQRRYEAWPTILRAGGSPGSFDDFVSLVLHPGIESRVPWLWRNQTDWQDQFLLDGVMHLENLEEEIAEKLDLNLQLSHKNTSTHMSWATYYTNPKTVRLVQEWAGRDFEQYAYPLEIP